MSDPQIFSDIYNADSLTLILWYNTVTDKALAPMIEAEITHRDLDGNKGSECITIQQTDYKYGMATQTEIIPPSVKVSAGSRSFVNNPMLEGARS